MLTRVTLTDSWLVSMISVIAGIKRHQGCSSRGKCTVGRHKPIDGKCENLSDQALLLRPERDVSGYEAETDPQLAGLSDLNDIKIPKAPGLGFSEWKCRNSLRKCENVAIESSG